MGAVTEATDHDLRSRRASPHGWVAWASRLVLSVLFAVGMFGAGSRPLVESELEPTVEIGEDAEVVAREGKDARIVRRHAQQRGTWPASMVARSRPPQRLAPTVRAPVPPRWQRPRRTPPADDDDIAIG
jgi:hypothetical protein